LVTDGSIRKREKHKKLGKWGNVKAILYSSLNFNERQLSANQNIKVCGIVCNYVYAKHNSGDTQECRMEEHYCKISCEMVQY
jgi:hypothetical protein